MKSLTYLIVEAGQEYNNEVELAGQKIVVNTTIESVENINREATVLASPEGTVLQAGDKVIIHHNIMRRKNNSSGKEIPSPFAIGDGKFFVPPNEVFAYKRGDSDWKALDPYCFVEPIKLEKVELESGILLTEKAQENFKGRENGVGIMKYSNQELMEEEEIFEGDRVHFEPWSEHEFKIDGKTYYKMKTSDILAKEPK